LFLLTVLIPTVTFRLFCLALCSIPSDSMEDTLLRAIRCRKTNWLMAPNCLLHLKIFRSRYWGFLPEVDINGKATVVLFNFLDGKFMTNRFFKRIK
jgi:hypothetical protein